MPLAVGGFREISHLQGTAEGLQGSPGGLSLLSRRKLQPRGAVRLGEPSQQPQSTSPAAQG